MRISTTLRLAILATMLVLASNLAVLGYVRLQTSDDEIDTLRGQVEEQANVLEQIYHSGGRSTLERTINQMKASDDYALAVALINRDGRIAISTISAPLLIHPAAQTSFQIARLSSDSGDRDAGFVIRRVGQDWLLSGRRLDDSLILQRTLERAIGIAGILSIVFGIVGGGIIAFYVGQRLRMIAHSVDLVTAGDMSRRAPIVSGGDAFDGLALRVNTMLDRIEGLMHELQLLTNSLAHDLRSPLSRLRVKVERAITIEDETQRDTALGGLLHETDIIMRMLSTLLEIGRSEAMAGRTQFDWTEPAKLLTDLVDMYEPVLDEARFALNFDIAGPIQPVLAHRELLAQAMSNLIDNAIKYGSDGKEITIKLFEKHGEIYFAVEDRGPGIAAEDESEARRRFGRLDSARSRPGAGLGLALVDAVARMHGGRLELLDNAPGLKAYVVLPQRRDV